MVRISGLFLTFLSIISCHPQSPKALVAGTTKSARAIPFDTSIKTIHVFVALCDNKYQGIIPVPPAIGNGQDTNSNLYWGCDDGVRSYFKRSNEWTLLRRYRLDSTRLERLVFQHKISRYFLIADAYDGRAIKQCTIDFLRSCAGQTKDTIHIRGAVAGINGNSRVIAYIGHDGLMDFRLSDDFQNRDGIKRDAIILACISKKYFAPFLRSTGANPLIWTTGLMCPEAYTLHDALTGYIQGASVETIRTSAAKAYNRNQRCGDKAARNLLVSGW
jgi:hypothetical protein